MTTPLSDKRQKILGMESQGIFIEQDVREAVLELRDKLQECNDTEECDKIVKEIFGTLAEKENKRKPIRRKVRKARSKR